MFFQRIKEYYQRKNVSKNLKFEAATFLNILLKTDFMWDESVSLFSKIKPCVVKYGSDWMSYFDKDVNSEDSIIPFTFHFSAGMAIRNELRSNSFSEEILGIDNLDYIYSELIEKAIKLG
jgi:hypothetical protein